MSLLSNYKKEYKEWLRKKREEVRKIKQGGHPPALKVCWNRKTARY